MTSAFDAVLGQESAIFALKSAVARGKVASAYLFEGPSGVGKRRAAMALAKEVIALSSGASPEETARRIDGGTHPDVRIILPRDTGHRNLQVQTVREDILPFTQFAPFEAKDAFLIFPEADLSLPEAHPEAANALLKTIEEPRAGLHFILLAERPDRLLVTIRSRCQRARFGALSSEILRQILSREGAPTDYHDAAVALAAGSADRALALAHEGSANALFARAAKVAAAVLAGKPGEMTRVAEEVAKGDDYRGALSALGAFYRDVAAVAVGAPASTLAFRSELVALQAHAARISAEKAADVCASLRELEESLESNANKDLGLLRVMMLAR
jgi:DNA polymerase-3 subunit delta'